MYFLDIASQQTYGAALKNLWVRSLPFLAPPPGYDPFEALFASPEMMAQLECQSNLNHAKSRMIEFPVYGDLVAVDRRESIHKGTMPMKRRTILIAIVLLLCACGLRAVRGSGRLVTESRDVRDFDRVSLTGSGEVILIQGEEESLTIETNDNVMRDVTSEVKGGTLTLGTESGKLISATQLRFTVTVRDLAGLTVSGSGDITAERVDTDRLEVRVSGSGDVQIDALTADRVEVRISGSGDVALAG